MYKKVKKDGFKLTKSIKHITESGEYWETQEKVISRYNDKGYLYRNRTNTLKMFLDKPYPDELTWAEKGKLGRIECEVVSDQYIMYKSGNELKPHTTTSLSKLLKSSERQVRELIKKCKILGIMGEAKIDGKRYLLLNPIYKLYGNRVSLTAFIVFERFLKEEIPEWAIRLYLEDMNLSDKKIEIID